MRHFSHRRKYTACSWRDSIVYSESRHDSYPQFPPFSLGTGGLQTRSHRQKKKTAFLETRFAQASSTKNVTIENFSILKVFSVVWHLSLCASLIKLLVQNR